MLSFFLTLTLDIEHWRLNSLSKFATPKHILGEHLQKMFATFLCVNVLQSDTFLVQFIVVETHPLISETVGINRVVGLAVVVMVSGGAVVSVVV